MSSALTSEQSQRFVLVYGALRSGTTLLRLMLDAHADIECRGEADFLFDHVAEGPDGSWSLDADRLQSDRIYRASPARVDLDAPAKIAVQRMASQLRSGTGHIVVIMIHRNLRKALTLFPEASVLHMLRDPRDVARSSIGMGWAGTVYHGVCHWLATEGEWSALGAELQERRVFTLRYEDLIRDPIGELSRLCGAFGTSYREEMLEYGNSSTYSAPDIRLIEQWKKKLSARDVSLVEGRCGPLLTERGYEPSGNSPQAPGWFEKAQLNLINKQSVWKHRITRYGLVDPVLVAMARRLHLPAIGTGAQRRINEKVVRYLK